MTQKELTELNLGETLDNLMNLDPRGYGVCRILYSAARDFTGAPLSMNAAKKLHSAIRENDIVLLTTGFVLRPFKKAEMDGIIGAVLLAGALARAYGAKPVIVCPEENLVAVRSLATVAGLHLYEDPAELKTYPVSMGVVSFTKLSAKAPMQADDIIEKFNPAAVISIECPGANSKGVYHNATGLDVTGLEAKTDILFEKLCKKGILNVAIGDLGNEIGMGTIGSRLKKFIPYAAKGECSCGCGGGIAAETKTDNIITATVSDWGCYALMAAIAYLNGNINIMHTAEIESEAIRTASRCGMIDMYGWLIPAIDGIDEAMHMSLVNMMRECVAHSLRLEKTCEKWFEKVIEKGYYNKKGFKNDSAEEEA